MAETSTNLIPLIQDCDGQPFVFHNPDQHRIEFVHGEIRSIIQLTKDTPVTVEPKVGAPGFAIREEVERRESLPGGIKAVYAKQAADYGEKLYDSRGHVYCSIKEYGPESDIIITVRRDKCHYFIYFPYGPYQPDEEKIA